MDLALNIFIKKQSERKRNLTPEVHIKFWALREDQTHDPPSSSLDALTNDL